MFWPPLVSWSLLSLCGATVSGSNMLHSLVAAVKNNKNNNNNNMLDTVMKAMKHNSSSSSSSSSSSMLHTLMAAISPSIDSKLALVQGATAEEEQENVSRVL